jgi:hypothetical protein
MKDYVTVRNLRIHLGVIALLCAILFLSSGLAIMYYTRTVDHRAHITSEGYIQTYSDVSRTVPSQTSFNSKDS